MRKTDLRGGANEYKISDVLGPKFREFVNLLETNKTLEPFTFAKWDDKAVGSGVNSPNANDIHYEFSEYLIAAAAAFRQIESPEYGKATIVSQYADVMYKIFDELISGSASTTNEPLSFAQLPYSHNDPNLKYLIPGFHLLPADDVVYKGLDLSPQNALINVIRYLYHYIALLDLDTVTAKDIITFLKGDKLVFMSYVDDIINIIIASNYFSNVPNLPISNSILKEGILNGLEAVAVQIINKLKNISQSGVFGIPIQNLETVVVTGKTLAEREIIFKNLFIGLGVDGAKAVTFVKLLDPMDKMLTQGAKAKDITNTTEEQRKTYAINSLLNPVYVLSDVIAKKVEPKQLLGGRKNRNTSQFDRDWDMTGGVRPLTRSRPAGVDKIPSLPNLYGPPLVVPPNAVGDDGKQNLTTEAAHGDQNLNAQLATTTKVQLVIDPNGGLTPGIVAKIVALGIDSSTNPGRVIALQMLNFIIQNNTKLADLTPADFTTISQNTKKALQAYQKISPRLQQFPKTGNYASDLSYFKDAFVSEFTNTTSKHFAYDIGTKKLGLHTPTTLPVLTASMVTKNNLSDPEIRDFYKKVIMEDPASVTFYSKFFNLVRLVKTAAGGPSVGEIPIAEANNIPDNELVNYRLNVRKEIGYTRLLGGLRGGAGSFGDIILVWIIPDYPTNGSIGDLWLTRRDRVPRATLAARGSEAIRDIVRLVYNRPTTDANVQIYGVQINLPDLIRNIAGRGYFNINYKDYFKNLLSGIATSKEFALTPTWKAGEINLAEHIQRDAARWERNGDSFIHRDEKGDEIPEDKEDPGDNCQFITNSTRECLDFFSQCLATDEKNFAPACARLLDFGFKFQVNTGMGLLKDEVMKINPIIAYAILKQFKFGSYLAEEKYEPIRGFRRYKVQSVGSWLEELLAGTDRCARPVAPAQGQCNPDPLYVQLGPDIADKILAMARDSKTYPFFNYLDILVQWVNANPQVLNPEETKNPKLISKWPPINKSFRTYSYLNPYKPAEVRLRGVSCGLERLKSSIMNELSGAQGSATISTIASVPLGIEMPLARPGFINPASFGNVIPMFGGGIYDTEAELQNINAQYGYKLFDQIYKDLSETMVGMTGDRKLKLTYNTQKNILGKLENFRKTEEELRKSLVGLIKRNQLYQASRGYVNPYSAALEDDNGGNNRFAAVLAKHSNLLHLSSSYNKKAVNLIDLFQTITKAILGKMDEGNVQGISSYGQPNTFSRPLTMGYHTDLAFKKN